MDNIIEVFQLGEYDINIFRSQVYGDIESHLREAAVDYSLIVVAGGDGTLNLALNAIMKLGINIPLGIIPAGTANDFARFINMPKDLVMSAKAIMNGRILETDIGLANDRYFINVCGIGLFANISQNVDGLFKAKLGKLAYYLKSMDKIQNLQSINVKISNSKHIYIENIYMFLALGSAGAGGFDNLAPAADISDGNFDFVAFKACPILELGSLFIKILKHDHLDDPNIIYFRDNFVKIELVQENTKYNYCDIDGEVGPKLPVVIKNIHKGLQLVVPK